MNKKLIALFWAIFIIGYCTPSYAQLRILPTTPGIVWECFESRVPCLMTVPPYRGDMSLNCLVGYYYYDSLMRSLTGFDQFDSLIVQITSLDTLKPFLKYIYALNDYDPVLFKQYRGEAYYLNTAYAISPAAVYSGIQSCMNAIVGAQSKTTFLVNCGPILHIIANDVAMTPHHYSNPRDSVHTFGCVWAKVLDTLKGQHLLPGACHDTGYISKQKGAQPQGGAGSSCINFSYDTRFVRGSTNNVIDIQLDSTGSPVPCSECYNDSSVVPGSEYIVALVPSTLGRDSLSDIYGYVPFTPFEPTGGIFPVIGGMVQDPSNFFGYGTSVPLATFESDIKTDISTILSY